MRHPDLVPPLPQDLQNRSFKGMDCAGWDFSGRDIRGCDFRKSNLRDADFTGVHTGRTKQQINREKIGIPIGVILGVVFGVMLMTAHKTPTVSTLESLDAAARMAEFTIVTAVALMFGAIATFVWLRLSAGMMAMTGAMSIAPLSVPIFNLINSPLNALPIKVVIFIVGAVFSSGAGVFYYRLTVKLFHNAIGTDFQGANLSGANFTDAMLKNCAFKQADLSQANWTNVSTSRCDRDVTKLV
jgi:Pentapeptide repeats (8 copies)